jgi:rhodanese-related sulfurtransferase
MHRKRAPARGVHDEGARMHAYNARAMDEIRNAAARRGKEKGLSYAGAVTPAEAHALMKAGAKLVDVRTKPELQYVGSIPGAAAVEWQTWPGGKPNPSFLDELASVAPKEGPVMFLCRSGVRLQHPGRLRRRQGCGRAPQHRRRLAQSRAAVGAVLAAQAAPVLQLTQPK